MAYCRVVSEFGVTPEDLFRVSGRLAGESRAVLDVAQSLRGQAGGTGGLMASAGTAFEALVVGWSSSLLELAAGIGTYAANTEAAGVAYESTDAAAAQSLQSGGGTSSRPSSQGGLFAPPPGVQA
jgi:hypothetical protein